MVLKAGDKAFTPQITPASTAKQSHRPNEEPGNGRTSDTSKNSDKSKKGVFVSYLTNPETIKQRSTLYLQGLIERFTKHKYFPPTKRPIIEQHMSMSE